jgi:tRNA threonylcarbamoyladenosine biosynthesis protein TsaB
VLTLALDTSTPTGSIALGGFPTGTGETVLELRLPVQAVRSESVLPAIDRLLRSAGAEPSAISRIVVGSGPGSFTGVRISAALAKGIRAALGAELHAWSSLAAIAIGSGASGRVCAAIDARRGQVYAAGYEIERNGPEIARLESCFGPAAEPWETTLDRLRPPTIWTLAAELPGPLGGPVRSAGLRCLSPAERESAASALLRLARSFPATGRIEDPARWQPDYVRASSAERESER